MCSARPNCRVYQKASFTTSLPPAPDKIITVVVKALLLPKMTITGVVALSWGTEMLLILRLHPQGEGIRATVIQGCCYMRGVLRQRGCIFKTASQKEISSTRMEKRTSRGLGTGGRICINTGIRDFELWAKPLRRGPGRQGAWERTWKRGAGRATHHMLHANATPFQLLKGWPRFKAQKHSLYLSSSTLYPQSKFRVYLSYFSSSTTGVHKILLGSTPRSTTSLYTEEAWSSPGAKVSACPSELEGISMNSCSAAY